MPERNEEWRNLLGGDDEARRARVKALSDEELTRIYSLLSDSRYIVNVPALPLLEEELERRGLPITKRH
jgi:hypothetical protein